jgi:hypothetical protein
MERTLREIRVVPPTAEGDLLVWPSGGGSAPVCAAISAACGAAIQREPSARSPLEIRPDQI